MSKFDLDDTYDGGMIIPHQCRWCCHYDGRFCDWGGSHDAMSPNDSCGCFKVDRKDNTNMDEYVRRLEDENNSLRRRNKKLTDDVVEIRKLLTERDGRIDDLVNRCGVMEKNCASCKKINASLAKDAADIEIDNYNLRKKNEALDKRATELVKSVEEKDEHIEKLKNELDEANAEIEELGGRITERHATNRELAKNCVRLETDNREKEQNINALQERLNDKDDVIADLEERLEHQKHIISNYERDIVRYSKSDEEKTYLENDISLSKAFYEIGEHVSLGFIDAIKAYGKKCEEEAKPKLSYKCCPEIKKLIDDSGYMRDYMERILRGDKPYNLDISSLYPNKFDLNPNADCPAYAARMKAKYDSLIKVGFTEDQAMSLIPMWTDE